MEVLTYVLPYLIYAVGVELMSNDHVTRVGKPFFETAINDKISRKK